MDSLQTLFTTPLSFHLQACCKTSSHICFLTLSSLLLPIRIYTEVCCASGMPGEQQQHQRAQHSATAH